MAKKRKINLPVEVADDWVGSNPDQGFADPPRNVITSTQYPAKGFAQPLSTAVGDKQFGVTIREALEEAVNHNKKEYSTIQKRMHKWEKLKLINLDADLSMLNDSDNLKRIVEILNGEAIDEKGEVIIEGVTPHAKGAFGKNLKAIITRQKRLTNTDVTNKVIDYEDLHRHSPSGFNIYRTRKARVKPVLPPVEKFNNALLDGLGNIEEIDVKGFTLLKAITGLRNPDITNITFTAQLADPNNPDKGLKAPYFDKRTNIIYGISNKGVPSAYTLGIHASSVLSHLADIAEAEGYENGRIFPNTAQNYYPNKASDALRQAFNDHELVLINPATGADKQFQLNDLRANIFSAIHQETKDLDKANIVLGHATKGDVGLEYYELVRQGEISASGQAMDEFFEKFKETTGWTTTEGLLRSVFGEDPTGNFTSANLAEQATDEEVDKARETYQKTADINAEESNLKAEERSLRRQQRNLEKKRNLKEQWNDLNAEKSWEDSKIPPKDMANVQHVSATQVPSYVHLDFLDEAQIIELQASYSNMLEENTPEARQAHLDLEDKMHEINSDRRVDSYKKGGSRSGAKIVKGSKAAKGLAGAAALFGISDTEAKQPTTEDRLKGAAGVLELFEPLPVTGVREVFAPTTVSKGTFQGAAEERYAKWQKERQEEAEMEATGLGMGGVLLSPNIREQGEMSRAKARRDQLEGFVKQKPSNSLVEEYKGYR